VTSENWGGVLIGKYFKVPMLTVNAAFSMHEAASSSCICVKAGVSCICFKAEATSCSLPTTYYP
jgi:hypothetical protein